MRALLVISVILVINVVLVLTDCPRAPSSADEIIQGCLAQWEESDNDFHTMELKQLAEKYGLSSREACSVSEYSQNSAELINCHRRLNTPYQPWIVDYTSYITSALSKVPKYTGKVYRWQLSKHSPAKALKKNDKLIARSFLSTSHSDHSVKLKVQNDLVPHTIYEIDVENQPNIEAFSFITLEKEILLKPGFCYKVTGSKLIKKGNINHTWNTLKMIKCPKDARADVFSDTYTYHQFNSST